MNEDYYDDNQNFDDDASGNESFEDDNSEDGNSEEVEWNENELNDLENAEWMEDFDENEAYNNYSEEPNFDDLDE